MNFHNIFTDNKINELNVTLSIVPQINLLADTNVLKYQCECQNLDGLV